MNNLEIEIGERIKSLRKKRDITQEQLADYVTAVAAVVDSEDNLAFDVLKSRLIDTSDMLSNLQDTVSQGRRVNLTNAVNNILQTDMVQ